MRTEPILIALDAGHDPKHPGNVNLGLKECDSTLLVATRVEHYVKLLSKVGNINSDARIDVLMTRRDTECPALSARTDEAIRQKVKLLVSIHTNGVINPFAHGAEAWISSGGSYRMESSKIARSILSNLKDLGYKNRGVKLDNTSRLGSLGLLDRVSYKMPAVLVEPCFASHWPERKKLLNKQSREDMAVAIAKAIVQSLGISPRVDLLL